MGRGELREGSEEEGKEKGIYITCTDLDDTAAVSVSRQVVDLSLEGVDYEGERFRVHFLYTLLDDVVAVLVHDTLQHVPFQFLHLGQGDRVRKRGIGLERGG